MADSELGTKQVCPSCEAKFYDLNKRPATCPKCGHSFDPADETVQATKTKIRTKAAKEAVPADEDDDDLEDDPAVTAGTGGDEEETDIEETAKELGGDEDEVALDMNASDGSDGDDVSPGKVPSGFTEEGVDDDEDAMLDDDEDEFGIDDEDLGLPDDDDDDETPLAEDEK